MSDIEDLLGIQHTVTVTSQARRGVTKVAVFARINRRWYNSHVASANRWLRLAKGNAVGRRPARRLNKNRRRPR